MLQYEIAPDFEWAWEQLRMGTPMEEVLRQLRMRPTWQARYAGLVERGNNGLTPMSEQEYLQWERQAGEMARQAGMPPGFYDGPEDFAHFIGTGTSINEYSDRLQRGWLKVYQAPPQVRDYFGQIFGGSGDGYLASFFLDPERSMPLLEQAAASAEFGGYGMLHGFNIGTGLAQQAGKLGMSASQVQSGFTQLEQQRPLTTEAISEHDDISDDDLAAGAFGVDANAGLRVRSRAERRAAAFGGQAVGPTRTQQGQTGLGAARTGKE
jgi:hypothetical protein